VGRTEQLGEISEDANPNAGPGRSQGTGDGAAGGSATSVGEQRRTPRGREAAVLDPDACAGYYPPSAEVDWGLVDVLVDVDADGRAKGVRVLGERPEGQGFGTAVQRCFLVMRFAPAQDGQGRSVAGRSRLRFRFVR
jgi:hypothetical protein